MQQSANSLKICKLKYVKSCLEKILEFHFGPYIRPSVEFKLKIIISFVKVKALIRDQPLPEPTIMQGPGLARAAASRQPGGLARSWQWYNHAAFTRDLTENERVMVFLKEEVQNQGSRRGLSGKVAKDFGA